MNKNLKISEMKNLEKTLIICIGLTLNIGFAQDQGNGKTKNLNNNIISNEKLNADVSNLKKDDVIIINKTPEGYYTYIIADEARTEQLKKGSKILGFVSDGLNAVGVNTGSVETLEAGRKLGNAVYMAEYGLRVNDFIKRRQANKKVVIDSIYQTNLYGHNEIIADFRIKRRAYKVYLKSALVSKEISLTNKN
jgi:hypothetical protein